MAKNFPAYLSLAIWAMLFALTYLEHVSPPTNHPLGRLARRYLPLQWFVVWVFLGVILIDRRLIPEATALEIIGVIGACAAILWVHLRRKPVWPERIRSIAIACVLLTWLVYLIVFAMN